MCRLSGQRRSLTQEKRALSLIDLGASVAWSHLQDREQLATDGRPEVERCHDSAVPLLWS